MLNKMMKVFFLLWLTGVATYALAENVVEIGKLKECAGKADAASLNCFREATKSADWPIRHVIQRNMEPSYITFGPGIRMGADQTLGGMLYEGQIFKNIAWDDGKIWHTTKHYYWLDVPIRIMVRQLNVPSKPVRTPSFNPGLRVYWYEDGEKERAGPEYPLDYYSFGVHHYSNGQEGVSTNPDGSVNTVNGSFSTNYAEFAWHRTWGEDDDWFRISFRQHFYGTFESFQHGQYEKRHLSGEYQWPAFNGKFLWWPAQYQFKVTETLGHGYDYVVRNEVNPALDVKANLSDKLHSTLELIVGPEKWAEMSLYLRYDYGYDYYNINFQERMNRLQFGLIGRTF